MIDQIVLSRRQRQLVITFDVFLPHFPDILGCQLACQTS
jgi:hypothetical protein